MVACALHSRVLGLSRPPSLVITKVGLSDHFLSLFLARRGQDIQCAPHTRKGIRWVQHTVQTERFFVGYFIVRRLWNRIGVFALLLDQNTGGEGTDGGWWCTHDQHLPCLAVLAL